MSTPLDAVIDAIGEIGAAAILAESACFASLKLLTDHGSDSIRYEITCWNKTRTRSTSRRTRSPQQLEDAVLLAERKYRKAWRGESPSWLSVTAKVGDMEVRFSHQQVVELMEAEQKY